MTDSSERGWSRFLLASVMFLGYETVLIAGFGRYLYTGVSSELGVMLMAAAAALGYLLYGALSGSAASLLIVPLPILIARGVDMPVPDEAWGGERPPLYVLWFYWSLFFVPSWVVGQLAAASDLRDRKENTQ